MVKRFKLSNSIIKTGEVVEATRESVVQVEMVDGTLKQIPSYPPHSKGNTEQNTDHLQEGDTIIAVFSKNAFEHTLSGVRGHTLRTIIYPGDKNYDDYLKLEKDPRSKEEHPVEIAFQKLKER